MPIHQQGMAKNLAWSNGLNSICTTEVMNSTVQDHQLGAAMICELSTINNSLMPLKQITDTPAKVFARLKAKVQRQNSEEPREVSVIHRQLGRGVLQSTNVQPPSDDATSEGQDTYVVTLSPPESTSKNSELEEPQMTSHLEKAEPVSALDKTVTETLTQVKVQQKKTAMNSIGKYTDINQVAYVLLERMPEDLLAELGRAKPTQLMNCVKNRSYHGVFGEMSVRDDSEGAVDDDSNRVDTLQRMDIAAQSQPEPQRLEKMPNTQCKHSAAPACTLPNLMEDSLLQLSPRISIPRKQMAVNSKQQPDTSDERTNVNGIHLRDWVLKIHNKEFIVDGIRIDNKIPWHSSCITERVSNNIVKTASGGMYVLVGKMSYHHSSSLPRWLMKKFLFGFPEMWKEYLKQFLAENEGSGKNRHGNNLAASKPQKKWISKQLKSKDLVTPVCSAGTVQPHSAPVSRSGRLIKPPLEYWRGGRITVGPDMNVTVHEDYSSNSILLTPKARPVVKSLKLPKEQPVYKSPEVRNTSDEDTSSPRQRVKHRKSWMTEGAKAWETASQNKSQDTVFNFESSSEVSAKQPFDKQAQSVRMYLRRGRSYSRERSSMGSESAVSELDTYCAPAKGGVSAIQAPTRNIKSQLNRKHLQKVIKNDKHSAPSSFSDTSSSSTQSQVQRDSDSAHSFTPPYPTKVSRRKALDKKSILVTQTVANSESKESDFSMQQFKVVNIKKTQRQKKVPQKYVITDASDESPPSEPIRKYKSKNSRLTLKRTRQRESSGASEQTLNLEQSKKTDDPHTPVPDSTGKKPKSSVNSKANRRNIKEQLAKHPDIEQDALEGAWTDKELQKLLEAVNSLPKHKSGYWVTVSLEVGTRSAEECQKQYIALYQTRGRAKGKHKAKNSKTDEPAKETAPITAKVGTLRRKKQMWEFLDHMPKDDHDDIFAGSPMHSRQIKLPVWSTNGDEPDLGHLQNPQTPISSMFSSVKTPQCLHITPGMLRSVNRDNNDKYIYHLQKVKRQGNYDRKDSPKDKFTPVPLVKKIKKRCVAEDDHFVVWNMLSEKDGPAMRGEEEEEDDYFMDEY